MILTLIVTSVCSWFGWAVAGKVHKKEKSDIHRSPITDDKIEID